MINFRFDQNQLRQLVQEDAKKIEEIAFKTALSTALKIVQKITTVVIPREPRKPVDRGRYRASWKALKQPYGASVENSLPYASIIEYGARSSNVKISKAMLFALESWVVRKGLSNKKHAKSIAYAVALTLKEKGIFNRGKGLRILQKSTEGFEQIIQKEFSIEFKKAFKEET